MDKNVKKRWDKNLESLVNSRAQEGGCHKIYCDKCDCKGPPSLMEAQSAGWCVDMRRNGRTICPRCYYKVSIFPPGSILLTPSLGPKLNDK